jgi:hypothetical protein
VDADGWCDIFFVGSKAEVCSIETWETGNSRTSPRARVLPVPINSRSAVFADIDGDADLDLIVSGLGTGTRCFVNDGSARFTEATMAG